MKPRTSLKLLFAIAVLFCCLPVRAVDFYFTNYSTAVLTNTPFQVFPVSLNTNNGKYIVVGLPVRVPATNGIATNINLLRGNYELRFVTEKNQNLLTDTFIFEVETDGDTNNVVDLRIPSVSQAGGAAFRSQFVLKNGGSATNLSVTSPLTLDGTNILDLISAGGGGATGGVSQATLIATNDALVTRILTQGSNQTNDTIARIGTNNTQIASTYQTQAASVTLSNNLVSAIATQGTNTTNYINFVGNDVLGQLDAAVEVLQQADNRLLPRTNATVGWTFETNFKNRTNESGLWNPQADGWTPTFGVFDSNYLHPTNYWRVTNGVLDLRMHGTPKTNLHKFYLNRSEPRPVQAAKFVIKYSGEGTYLGPGTNYYPGIYQNPAVNIATLIVLSSEPFTNNMGGVPGGWFFHAGFSGNALGLDFGQDGFGGTTNFAFNTFFWGTYPQTNETWEVGFEVVNDNTVRFFRGPEERYLSNDQFTNIFKFGSAVTNIAFEFFPAETNSAAYIPNIEAMMYSTDRLRTIPGLRANLDTLGSGALQTDPNWTTATPTRTNDAVNKGYADLKQPASSALTNLSAFGVNVPYVVTNVVFLPGNDATNSFLGITNNVLYIRNATNAPGGGGSQTPWTSDINGAAFSLTNTYFDIFQFIDSTDLGENPNDEPFAVQFAYGQTLMYMSSENLGWTIKRGSGGAGEVFNFERNGHLGVNFVLSELLTDAPNLAVRKREGEDSDVAATVVIEAMGGQTADLLNNRLTDLTIQSGFSATGRLFQRDDSDGLIYYLWLTNGVPTWTTNAVYVEP